MRIVLPLGYVHPLKTKKDKKVKYSLNQFMLDFSPGAQKHNHRYQFFAKKHLQALVEEQIKDLPVLLDPFPKSVVLEIYRPNNRLCDIIDNPVVLTKFVMDIVKEQKIEKDIIDDPTVLTKLAMDIFKEHHSEDDIISDPSILIKFAMDVVKENHAPDDNWKYFDRSSIIDMGVDKDNPRAELVIDEYQIILEKI